MVGDNVDVVSQSFASVNLKSTDNADENTQPLSKSALKKIEKQRVASEKKAVKLALAEKEKNDAELKRLESAKAIQITLDSSLDTPIPIQVKTAADHIDKRVVIQGWVQLRRKQGAMVFVDLRDGTGFPSLLQTVLTGNLAKTYDALTLHRETSIRVYGTVFNDDRAQGGVTAKVQKAMVELRADFWEIIGTSNDTIEARFNEDSDVSTLLDNRGLNLRSWRLASTLKMRSYVTQAFREFFFKRDFYEVTPPTLVQNEVEGGSTLFEVNYYGERAFLTQSSQLYLESAIPALGNVFSILSSYRAERSKTRRHLSEYSHVEGEMAFLSFDNLLTFIEDMVCEVSQSVLDKAPGMLRSLNKDFNIPTRPFLRMKYEDAIQWLNDNNVLLEDEASGESRPFVFGDDIPEKPERHMTDTINKPILLHGFPVVQKPFYMSRPADDARVTESVDLLLPSVGEIVGGSMREWKMDKLSANYAEKGLAESEYGWYNDLRRFGTCPHGGFGLGLERFLCWMLNIHHIRDATMYPRYIGRCLP